MNNVGSITLFNPVKQRAHNFYACTVRGLQYYFIYYFSSGTGISDPAMQIKEWLNDIKMSSYILHFTQAGFNQLSDLAGLLDSDLQGIGISLIGHRNKMLRTICSLSITDQSKETAWKRAPSLVV